MLPRVRNMRKPDRGRVMTRLRSTEHVNMWRQVRDGDSRTCWSETPDDNHVTVRVRETC